MNKLILIFIIFSTLSINGYAQIDVVKIKSLSHSMNETSGLVFYQNKFLITHNDGGNKSELFVLETLGSLIKKIN
jgi:hypothetical protein